MSVPKVALSAPALDWLARIRDEAQRQSSVWLFAYGSLIWQPAFEVSQTRLATLRGWHRGLKMWSRINRGTPERPGLVFALLPGGSCRGLLLQVKQPSDAFWMDLWQREMPSCVYVPKWVAAQTDAGPVQALAFTLSRQSPNYTGVLRDDQLRAILSDRVGGRYGHTFDYAQRTHQSLLDWGIHDAPLARILALASDPEPSSQQDHTP